MKPMTVMGKPMTSVWAVIWCHDGRLYDRDAIHQIKHNADKTAEIMNMGREKPWLRVVEYVLSEGERP